MLIMALGEGLTQGQATIIAAGIAVGAASIAFLGILVKARSDRALHEATLGEDRAVQHRQQVTEALLSALEAMNRADELVSSNNPIMERDSDAYRDRDRRYYACVSATLKLQILGLEDAHLAMSEFTGSLGLHWAIADEDGIARPHWDTFGKIIEAKASLPYTFSNTLAQLDQRALQH
ncbi:hypothetical protein RER_pREL1-00640 (plasmid) [Rhodococcus erythropolis PR4]|uniref:DUF4760 domain-containing protein n=2 Tax=Nocardiaceae TaxID=85025 RepID=Q3L9V6_RHOE4|nr:hypothetical protein RHOER0001_6618 [Rhodococcus erythropolis SK121]MBF7737390.1 hypothetical protein [Rhodococcus erythropolis]BAE46007.1 hypothetical protein RER_pREL1-00640 [Rhodococcus erythropolis PR4]